MTSLPAGTRNSLVAAASARNAGVSLGIRLSTPDPVSNVCRCEAA